MITDNHKHKNICERIVSVRKRTLSVLPLFKANHSDVTSSHWNVIRPGCVSYPDALDLGRVLVMPSLTRPVWSSQRALISAWSWVVSHCWNRCTAVMHEHGCWRCVLSSACSACPCSGKQKGASMKHKSCALVELDRVNSFTPLETLIFTLTGFTAGVCIGMLFALLIINGMEWTWSTKRYMS